jgi:hypothetical protein
MQGEGARKSLSKSNFRFAGRSPGEEPKPRKNVRNLDSEVSMHLPSQSEVKQPCLGGSPKMEKPILAVLAQDRLPD